jgi:hypothetical protein
VPLELKVFCTSHSIPHEDCPNCLTTVAAMRPTVFAELAAAEMRSGTESCGSCDYVYHEVVARSSDVFRARAQPAVNLHALTLRDLAAAIR